MNDEIKNRVEHLLDERRASVPDRVDARLAATFAEGLRDLTRAGRRQDEPATMAAFLDGRLSEAELNEFRAALVSDPSLRADLEAGAALVDSIPSASQAMPKDVLARAQAEFAPAAPRQQATAWARLTARLWPGQTGAWAFAAGLLMVAVIGPATLMIGDRAPGPDIGYERPTASPAPPVLDDNVSQRPGCESTPDQKPKPKAEEARGTADERTKTEDAKPAEDTDPCPHPAPADNGGPPN